MVEVVLGFDKEVRLARPDCGSACGRYDSRKRSWRHLGTMQYKTVLTAEIPKVQCKEHGVKQVAVPWAGPGSRFTALFESLVIDWLSEASTKAVAQMLRMTWDEVDGVMQRAVKRGLGRRESQPLHRIGQDEASFQQRHEYVTVICDVERARVLEVLNGRKQEDVENSNAKIQALKKRACGYRNRDRFRHAILFHCGGLDLHPRLDSHTVP